MVFYVRTRRGFDELVQLLGAPPSPLWIERDVSTEAELTELRSRGLDVTNFTTEAAQEVDISTVRMHHPNDIIWAEF
jgi:hypothetical protein